MTTHRQRFSTVVGVVCCGLLSLFCGNQLAAELKPRVEFEYLITLEFYREKPDDAAKNGWYQIRIDPRGHLRGALRHDSGNEDILMEYAALSPADFEAIRTAVASLLKDLPAENTVPTVEKGLNVLVRKEAKDRSVSVSIRQLASYADAGKEIEGIVPILNKYLAPVKPIELGQKSKPLVPETDPKSPRIDLLFTGGSRETNRIGWQEIVLFSDRQMYYYLHHSYERPDLTDMEQTELSKADFDIVRKSVANLFNDPPLNHDLQTVEDCDIIDIRMTSGNRYLQLYVDHMGSYADVDRIIPIFNKYMTKIKPLHIAEKSPKKRKPK